MGVETEKMYQTGHSTICIFRWIVFRIVPVSILRCTSPASFRIINNYCSYARSSEVLYGRFSSATYTVIGRILVMQPHFL